MEVISKLCADIFSESIFILLTLATVLTIAWQATGFAINRQWSLTIPYIGLIGLASFLVNPVADNQSSVDLIRSLSSPQLLQYLCITQLVTIVAVLLLNLKAIKSGVQSDERWWFLSGICLSLPSPILITSILVIEHRILNESIGARPEVIGTWVALTTMLLAISYIAIASCIPTSRLIHLHLLTSLALMAVILLFPTTIQDIPNGASTESDLAHWISFGIGFTISLLVVGMGFFYERMRWSQSISTEI